MIIIKSNNESNSLDSTNSLISLITLERAIYTCYQVSRVLENKTFGIAQIPPSTAANCVIKVMVSETTQKGFLS